MHDTAEQADFRASIRRWVDAEVLPHVAAWDEAGAFPRALYRRAAALGLLQLGYPEPLGGTPQALERLVQDDGKRWAGVIAAGGIKMDQ